MNRFIASNEFKATIEVLEKENEALRNKADYFEKETLDLERKQTTIIEGCVSELSKHFSFSLSFSPKKNKPTNL